MDLNLLRTFCKVAELGSFTAAAKALGQPKSRVSRAVARLEEDLGTELLKRSTRRIGLSTAGQQLFESSRGALEQLSRELDQIAGQDDQIAGTLKITLAEDLAAGYFDELVDSFWESHPQVNLTLYATNHYMDPIAEGLDFALRIGNLPDSSLRSVVLGQTRPILVAAPEYLQRFGRPYVFSDLSRHRFLEFVMLRPPEAPLGFAQVLGLPQDWKGRVRATHFGLLRSLALRGRGIAVLPDFHCHDALKTGRLERLLPDWAVEPRRVQAVFPPGRALPLRARLFLEHLKTHLAPLFG